MVAAYEMEVGGSKQQEHHKDISVIIELSAMTPDVFLLLLCG